MLDLLRRLDLAAEAAQEHVVLRQLGGDHLQGDRLLAVGRALEHDPHPAAADHAGDLVRDRANRPVWAQARFLASEPRRISLHGPGPAPYFRWGPLAPAPSTHDTSRDLAYGQATARLLQDRGDRRRRAHGNRVPRHGFPKRTCSGPQGPARGCQHRSCLPRALPARGRAARRAAPSARDPDLRDGRDRRRAVHRHPARDREPEGPDHRRPARRSTTRRASSRPSPRPSTPPTRPGSCTATSSRPTCCSTPAMHVYLGDFGLARDPDGAALTLPGQVLGTLDYMAPEHLEAEGVGTAGRHLRPDLPRDRDAHRRGPVHPRHRRGRDVRACRRGAPERLRPATRAARRARRSDRSPAWPRTPTTARRRLARCSPTCCARSAGRSRPAWSRPAEGADRRVSEPDSGAAVVPGTVFSGRYEIIAPISSGAMGAVYRARDLETRRRGRGQAAARRPPRRALRDRGAPAVEPQPPARREGARPLAGRRRGSTSSWTSSTAPTSAPSSRSAATPGCRTRTRSSTPATPARRSSTCTTSRSCTATSSRRT